MQSTQQRVYSANLQQNFGYPLRTPSPSNGLTEPYTSGGFQIGDIGHVDHYGEFKLLFNIKFPPKELQKLDLPGDPKFDQPSSRKGCERGTLFLRGVKRSPGKSRTDQGYKFIATSVTGAILILPDGAALFELEDKYFEDIQKLASKYAVQWCRYAGRDSLYLLTAVYKTNTWTLGSFSDGFAGGEIYVDRKPGTSVYDWECAFTMDYQRGPGSNFCQNQTVFIKGFKMAVRRDLLQAIEQLEKPERWFTHFLAKLQLKTRKWLSGQKIEYFPATLHFSQPSHPLDIVNHVLLDKNPEFDNAVTHDNEWMEMLENALPFENLMEERSLRQFIEEKYTCNLNSEHRTVYLRSNFDRNNHCEHKPADGRNKPIGREHQPSPHYAEDITLELERERADEFEAPEGNSWLVITNIRLENFVMDHVDAGVCVLIQFGTTTRRTENKPCANVIEWSDEIMLPPSHQPVYITVCGAFQLGSALGTRELSEKQSIIAKDLPRRVDKLRLFVGNAESRCSLLITLEQHFSYCKLHFSHEDKSVFVEKTIHGLEAFYSYQNNHQKNDLESALECFRDALGQCGPDIACCATAHFNLATSEFIKCQASGTYSELDTPIGHYREALKLRGDGHPDRPATLLLLAQALLSRHGQDHDESVAEEIQGLLVDVPHDNSRNRRAADAVTATCRFYQSINFRDPAEIDGLLKDLERGTYAPPYGYFDRPRLVHKLGTAFWRRFQSSAKVDDLDQSINLNMEAFQLVPYGHDDQRSILDCLGNSLLRALEAREELGDLDMSPGLAELGKKVVAKTSDMSSVEGVEVPLELLKQIELMSAADDTIQAIINQDPSPRIPEVQSFIDEWNGKESTPTKCKKELAVLLSFLGGEGETKMSKVLEELGVQWPFKDHKIAGATRALQESMPYFFGVLAAQLVAEAIDGGVIRHSKEREGE